MSNNNTILRIDAKGNMSIRQNETFVASLEWLEDDEVTPIDITGYTAALMIRLRPDDDEVLLSLDSSGNGITIDGANGVVNIVITHAQTALLHFAKGSYDLVLTDTDDVATRLLEGTVTLLKGNTR